MRLGILGAGQLGRMLALAAIPFDIECNFLDPSPHPPASKLGRLITAPYEDRDALLQFTDKCDVITFEFENVPVECVKTLSKVCRIFPPPKSLEISQDRLLEKLFFQSLGISVPEYFPIPNSAEIKEVPQDLSMPALLKTRRLGYDGKGQWMVRNKKDIEDVLAHAKGASLIMETIVPFEKELSLILARAQSGDIRFYPLIENTHRDGILHLSISPLPTLAPSLQKEAELYGLKVAEELEYVGVMAIEFFLWNGSLLANEMAPRVHNSGHWTIEGAETSQFENHIRSIMGFPLGSVETRGYSAMINFIGSIPDRVEALNIPGAHLHLYGKTPRPHRKLGHLTLRSDSLNGLESLLDRVNQLI